MSTKGQIVIPREVREKLRIKAGQKFEVDIMSDGTILVIPIPHEVLDSMQLPDAEKLETALREERTRDEEKQKAITKGPKHP